MSYTTLTTYQRLARMTDAELLAVQENTAGAKNRYALDQHLIATVLLAERAGCDVDLAARRKITAQCN